MQAQTVTQILIQWNPPFKTTLKHVKQKCFQKWGGPWPEIYLHGHRKVRVSLKVVSKEGSGLSQGGLSSGNPSYSPSKILQSKGLNYRPLLQQHLVELPFLHICTVSQRSGTHSDSSF